MTQNFHFTSLTSQGRNEGRNVRRQMERRPCAVGIWLLEISSVAAAVAGATNDSGLGIFHRGVQPRRCDLSQESGSFGFLFRIRLAAWVAQNVEDDGQTSALPKETQK